MAEFFVKLVVAGIVMGLIDGVWLGVVANKLYKSELGNLLRPKPDMVAAVLFYVIYVIGIVVFAVLPAAGSDSAWVALGLGGLFGLVAYATYDLTNLATLKDFSRKIVVIDMVWGTVLTASVSVLTYLVTELWL